MMRYKDFIKAGNRCVYMPNWDELSWYSNAKECIVRIGEYPVYYTNGEADPKPDDYDECCYVEAYPESEKIDELQFRLHDLHPIEFSDEKKSVIYGGRRCKFIGNVLELDYEGFVENFWDDNGYSVIEDSDGNWKVVDSCDLQEERDFYDLSFDELKKLRTEICLGSIYINDYNNSLGIDASELEEITDDYWWHIHDEDGNKRDDVEDTPEEFANFYCNCA